MTRKEIDKIFELCLLLVTVIGAAELQYASYFFGQIPPEDPPLSAQKIAELMHSNTILVNSIFRWTTFTIFVLVLAWIILMIFPSVTIKQPILKRFFKRRYGKEFCWCLFGNLFLMEMINFVAISFSAGSLSKTIVSATTLSAFFLTFYATWKYRKEDIYEMRTLTKTSMFWSVIEHTIIYMISYIIMIVIWGYSIIIPTL
ncbi:MAG: hypothetical protein NWF05_06100 [Candidatus Bathyarchaeota archaeon]|nr:hypothetical protein [Candidatus Bathyarchaeota archaeon]